MGRIIVVSSGKGGVGKTTFVTNIATALAKFNKNVVAVDGNLTTSNLGLHLGIPLYPVTLQDVIKGKAGVKDAVYHHPEGFKIVPADISLTKLMLPRSDELLDVFYKLAGNADVILIDSAAGLGKEAVAAIEAADEMITVTNPELTALTDALKLAKIAESKGTKNLGVVINRIRKERHEFSEDAVKDFLNMPVIGKVYEDRNVARAIAKKVPLVSYRPHSTASHQFKAIAANLIGEEYKPRVIVSRLFGWLLK